MRDDLVPLLDAHLDAFSQRPFQYGASDCVMFVRGWLKACRISAPLPVYDSLDEGKALLAAMGCADWCDAVTKVLPPRELLRIRVGDVVALRDTRALGIFDGAYGRFLRAEEPGLVRVRLSHCDRAWSVEPCPQ